MSGRKRQSSRVTGPRQRGRDSAVASTRVRRNIRLAQEGVPLFETSISDAAVGMLQSHLSDRRIVSTVTLDDAARVLLCSVISHETCTGVQDVISSRKKMQ